MSLLDQLQDDLKQAMRDGNAVARDALRMTMTALKNRRIEKGEDLNEGEELAVVTKQVKSRQDSAEQYTNANRPELAEKELAEIKILEGYLPKQLSAEEVKALVEARINELGISKKSEIGQLMKSIMSTHKGQLDGKAVQQAAGSLLS